MLSQLAKLATGLVYERRRDDQERALGFAKGRGQEAEQGFAATRAERREQASLLADFCTRQALIRA